MVTRIIQAVRVKVKMGKVRDVICEEAQSLPVLSDQGDLGVVEGRKVVEGLAKVRVAIEAGAAIGVRAATGAAIHGRLLSIKKE